MSHTSIAILSGCLAATFGAVMPCSLRMYWGKVEGRRWIQHCPSVNVYVAFIMPVAVGASAYVVAEILPLPFSQRNVLLSVLVLSILVLTAASFAYADFMEFEVLPFLLPRKVYAAGTSLHSLDMYLRNTPDADADKKAEYGSSVTPFGTLAGARERGNGLIYFLLFQNLVSSAFVAAFFWFCGIAAYMASHRIGNAESLLPVLTAAFAVLLLWVPLQIYSNWYQISHYNINWSTRQQAFGVLMAVAAAIVLLLWIGPQPALSIKVLATGFTFLCSALGVLAKIGWGPALALARAIAAYVQELTWRNIWALYVVTVATLVFLVAVSIPPG